MQRYDARLNRICFRLDRQSYWRIKEMARLLEITPSYLVNAIVAAFLDATADSSTETAVEYITAALRPSNRARFVKAVEKALDDLSDNEVPW